MVLELCHIYFDIFETLLFTELSCLLCFSMPSLILPFLFLFVVPNLQMSMSFLQKVANTLLK